MVPKHDTAIEVPVAVEPVHFRGTDSDSPEPALPAIRSLQIRIGSHLSISVQVSPTFLTMVAVALGGVGGNAWLWLR